MKWIRLLAAVGWCLAAPLALAADFAILDRAAAEKIANPASHDRPTIVALWSYDCVYCKKNLKLFSEMVRAHPQLRLVTVAVEPAAPRLAEPLDRLAVPGARYAYGDAAPEALAYALDPNWRGELPRTLIFDGRGGKHAVSGVVAEPDARRSLGLTTAAN
ncbi:TlpA family protein disulfide reductase [Aromatoleum sp.]|uniref:TlpA family protein disulfide reductase n=1 Tax=Aromatoleum sp. TaxID=2307007 RepID=UPI002FC83D3F